MNEETAIQLCTLAEAAGNSGLITTQAGDPYLMRYMLMKTPELSIYLHRFLRSDPAIPHDHPWDFHTHVIKGGYVEEKWVMQPDGNLIIDHCVERLPGTTEYRPAESIHRVVLDRVYAMDELREAPLTMCVIQNYRRPWGFVESDNGTYTWTDWRKYLGITPDDPRFSISE